MNLTNNQKFSINHDPIKGRCLIANETIYTGEIIFEELPLVCSQFLWNAECKYDACQFCLTPLETAEENVTRLTKEQIQLPYVEQCCQTNKSKHINCSGCGQNERYCSIECCQLAYEHYHQLLCPSRSKELENNLNKLCDLWKSIHYPPETASIMLLVKILARIKQDPTFIEKLQQFSSNIIVEQTDKLVHILCGDKFHEQIEILRQIVSEIFSPNDEILQPFLTENGFKSLLAIIGKNGQGIGTSAFSQWAKNCEQFLANNPEELDKINQLTDSLFDKLDEISGCFLNNEGSGLYELQSCINHSCQPNSEVCFLKNNFILSLKAIETINQGEEITICYLDECWQNRSRHSRNKYLQKNYLFICQCRKCQQQINDPDVTSDEEEDSDLQSNPDDDDDDAMNCD
ncbi:SET and MYND domain-containing protein 5 [Dermatophagoides pteronyssinus]|uniref:SET and MYND domain-containing protein 5 n=1 Tax=Dermatophagoides pteronyssinus TaxID=6956 RepID=A0ABQ8JPS5_DERPT|nr:SET and MYND domain-containing protein 5 [Dermatophagoides pteronyssinus]